MWIALTWAILISLTGCTTAPEFIPEYEVIEVERDRYVQIPAELTRPLQRVDKPPRSEYEAMDNRSRALALLKILKAHEERAQACDARLIEISTLGDG